MKKSVLVTGGAGFIGSNLISHLNLNRPDWSIRVIDDFSSGLEQNLSGCLVEVHSGTILDTKTLDLVSKGVDSIIHLAAIGSVPRSIAAPRPTHEANTTGTLNVLEAARKNSVGQVIVASSSSVYGSNPSNYRSEFDWTRPLSPYAVSKLTTEAYANAYWKSYGLNTLAFRFFNVYGPKQRADHPYAAVIPKFISAVFRGESLNIYGSGEQSRDFTYVDAVSETISQACDRALGYEHPLNLAFGSNTTINELVQLLEQILNRPISVERVLPRTGDVLKSQADPTIMRKVFGDVEQTDFEVGLRKTVEWFKENL